MRSMSAWLALASIPAVSLASPIDTEYQSSIHPRDSDNSADALNKEFLGIHWDVAKETCSDDQLNAIIRATRKANEMTALAVDGKDPADTAAWHRYFVKDNYGKLDDTWSKNFELWSNVIQNFQQVRGFPTEGKRNNKLLHNRVTYRCKSAKEHAGCAYPTAATTRAETGNSETQAAAAYEWTITFCPYFFERLPHVEDWTDKKNLKPNELLTMHSRETAVIHEFMHSDIIGTKKVLSGDVLKAHIADIEAAPPPYNNKLGIYGDGRAHAFAWQYVDSEKRINKLTSGNADTYALYFTYNWLSNHFSWSEDGSESYVNAKRDNDKADIYNDRPVDADSISIADLEVPDTCTKGPNGQPQCTYDNGWKGTSGVGNVPQKCDLDKSSGLPAKVFKEMYGQFCKAVGEADHRFDSGWQVGNKGDRMHLIRRGDLESRSPPVSSSDYPHASAYLNFMKKGDGECTMTCEEAFDSLAQSNCGTTGGEQSAMATSGRIDAGCGKYVFSAFTGEGDSKPPTYSGLAPTPSDD